MLINLKVVAGPHTGRSFQFSHHDTFLVGRSQHAHFQLPAKDKYFSRIHFMIEVNPPQCRLVDMGSHNGTYVNGQKALAADLFDGDEIRAGHTVIVLSVQRSELDPADSISLDPEARAADSLPVPPGYAVVRELGRGVLGQTFQATRQSDGRAVAIKLVPPRASGSSAKVQAFLKQARGLLDLEHPCLTPLRDLGVYRDVFFFVWDFVPGRSAEAILQAEKPLAARRVLRWSHHLLQGLEAAHARGYLFRDLRPSNLVIQEIDGQETAFWTGFGLSRIFSASPFGGLTMTADVLNSAAFLPPESITNYQAPTQAGDQYALAANLYFLFTGEFVYRLPRNHNRRFSILLKEQVVPIQERRPDLPTGLAQVIHRGLSRQPTQRYVSVAAFHQALAQAVQSDG